MYIDDVPGNCQKMYEVLSTQGIECYSFTYLRKNIKPLQTYFSDDVYEGDLKNLEVFLEKLLKDENVENLFLKSRYGEYIRH